MKSDDRDIVRRFENVRLVVLDIDGVLTDGHIIYDDFGDELKFFDISDGMGISLLRKAGIETVMLTARKCKANRRRAKELNVGALYQNASDKLGVFNRVLKARRLSPQFVCAVGDDLIDIPVMSRAGLAVAVQNARAEVKQIAHYVTTRTGGRGAVREIADKILKLQGKWERATVEYFR